MVAWVRAGGGRWVIIHRGGARGGAVRERIVGGWAVRRWSGGWRLWCHCVRSCVGVCGAWRFWVERGCVVGRKRRILFRSLGRRGQRDSRSAKSWSVRGWECDPTMLRGKGPSALEDLLGRAEDMVGGKVGKESWGLKMRMGKARPRNRELAKSLGLKRLAL